MDLKFSEMPPVATLNDNDFFPLIQYPVTPTSNKTGSWSLVKSMLKTYFDPIYASAGVYEFVINKKHDLSAPDNIGYPTTLAVDNVRANLQGQIDTLATAPSSWKLNGTTVGAEKFIGTLDNFEFPIRVNNVEKVRVVSNGAKYAANYSETYTDRHLVDKEYIDNIGAVTFSRYRANTGSTAATDPGIGNLRWNNAAFQNASTELYVDSLTDGFGINVDNYFALITPDTVLYIQKQNDATQYQRWRVMSATNMTGWWKFVVQPINNNGGNIVNSAPILLGVNLSPSAYSGSSWGWNGSTVGTEKWIGTKDNFDFPVRVNDVEIARFKTAGLGVGISPTARLHVKGTGGNMLRMEDSTGTFVRFNVNDLGQTTIIANDPGLTVNIGGSNIFRVANTHIILGTNANTLIGPWNGTAQSAAGFGLYFKSNGTAGMVWTVDASTGTTTPYRFGTLGFTEKIVLATAHKFFAVNPAIAQPASVISSTAIQTVFSVSPAINITGGTSVIAGVDYDPTLTAVIGLTHYGILIRPNAALNGFGTAAPTASLHVKGRGSSTAELLRLDDAANVNRFLMLDNGITTQTGASVLEADYIHTWRDSTGSLIARLSNGKFFELGGSAAFLTVSSTTVSGDAGIRFLPYSSGAGLAYRMQDTTGTDFLTFRNLTADKAVTIRQVLEVNQLGETRFEKHFYIETTTTASAQNVVFEFTLADGEHYDIKILHTEATATDGVSINSLGMDAADARKVTGTNIEGTTSLGTKSELPTSAATTANFNWNLDTVNQKIQYRFQNHSTGKTWSILVVASYMKRITPAV